MEWVLAGFVIVVMAVAAVVGSGRWGAMPGVTDDRPPGRLAAGRLTPADLRQARFAVVPRGYSMAQVDALLARLADQLDAAPVQSGAHKEAADARQATPEIGSDSQHLE